MVELISPAGTSITLHDRAGGQADNLFKTYAQATTPRLQDLRGEAIQGEWRLKVSDRAAADAGKLKRWVLKIMREPQGGLPPSNTTRRPHLDTATGRPFSS
ncbi:MAG: proprotein convertase P-domain-containing protein [Actinomycetota bacterium]|nr:proprotein convertase P-domain-containing protein [Actinomycetota bacterium]